MYLIHENLDQLIDLNINHLALVLLLLTDICSNYYFFKPDFNCCNSFALSWVDNITTGTLCFVSVIANIAAFASLNKTHLLDQVKMRLISQLIKAFQEFSKIYLNILMALLFQFLFHPVIFCFNLNEALLFLAAENLATAPTSFKASWSL